MRNFIYCKALDFSKDQKGTPAISNENKWERQDAHRKNKVVK
jgi:hypothetical protein